MISKLRWLLSDRIFNSVLLAYGVGGVLLFGFYRHQINPDGVAYISIAHHYADGRFADAVNGYWGPMLSWLLTPFAVAGVNMQAAAKAIALLAGLAVIVLAWVILKRWRVHRRLALAAVGVLVPLCWYWALPSPITPDVLMVPLVLGYVYILGSDFKGWRLALGLGLIGAAGYFIKSYFLPFFVMHLAVWVLWRWYAQRKKEGWRVVVPYALGACMTLVLISPWVVLISLKYHQVTVSTSGSYNFNLIGPGSLGHPVTSAGLLPPPNKTATTAWEDPTYTPIPSWSPLSSRANAEHYARVILENLRVIGLLFVAFSVFALAIWAGSLVLGIRGSATALGEQLLLLCTVAAIYTAGYALVVREERYLWPVFALTVLAAAAIASAYKLYKKSWANGVAIGLVVVSIVVTPLVALVGQYRAGDPARRGADLLQPLFTGRERIASDSFDSFAYCYYLRAQCYGQFNPATQGDKAVQRQLREHSITDVLLLKTDISKQKPAYLAGYEVVTTANPALTLLRLKQR